MKMWKEKTWQHVITGTEGNTTLFGVNIFDFPWKDTGKTATVKENMGKIPIYQVTINNEVYEFAATEVSNCVWEFYAFKY